MNELVKRVAKNLAGRLGCVPDDSGCESHPERAWDTGYGLCGVAVLLAEDAVTTMRAEPDEAMVDRFKAEWHRADAEGDTGNRVRRALAAAAPVLDEGKIAEVIRGALPCEVQSSGPNEPSEWRYRTVEDADRHVEALARAVVEALGGAR